ncbi:MAG: Gfo/Idh/MocA family oxidoreductase [Anaerolineae bacterium]|nr:Gfo/Idh/MocA family oxidoreductase [Anaerolineae bacterium]
MKVIQVGIGGMGNTWLKTVLASSEVEYAALVEVNEDIGRQQAEKYGLDRALIFRSLPEALAAVSADGVIDVTPPAFHREISAIALEAGLPVLSEKPLANTLADAVAIVQKANETGVLHMVAQNYRYHGPVQTLKSVLASGEFGRVGSVSVEFFKGPHFGGFREEMDYPLIIDMAIHHFDLMRFLLESDPVTTFGRSWNPPWSWYKGDASASVSLEFASGVMVAYNGSWCSTGRETSWNAHWRFECERGVITLQDDRVYAQARNDELLNRGGYSQFSNGEVIEVKPVELRHVAQAYLLHEFYQAVTQHKAVATTCQDNIKSLGIVFDVIKSCETGEPVRSGETKR